MAISSSQRRDESAEVEQSDRAGGRTDAAVSLLDDDTLDLSALQAALHPALGDLPREPRQARSREKRAALLRAAEPLFTERG